MSHPNLSRGGRAARLAATLALLASVFCVQAAWAQSGRRAPKPSTPPPAADPQQEQGESESVSRRDEAKKTDALVSFIVMRHDDAVFAIDPMARDGVAASFVRRLGQSHHVAVTDGGKGRRQEARARAKEQEKAYVVLFNLEEEMPGSTTIQGRPDSRALVLRTYVYTPKTGDLKYTDTVYQRPYQETARVGGVRIPVPTRRIERYPSQHELEQAARDAADRLLARFRISPPPDN